MHEEGAQNESAVTLNGKSFWWKVLEHAGMPTALIICTLIGCWTAGSVVENRKLEADAQLADARRRDAEGASLQITGNVIRPELVSYNPHITSMDLRRVTLAVVLANNGTDPFDVTEATLRVRRAELPQYWCDELTMAQAGLSHMRSARQEVQTASYTAHEDAVEDATVPPLRTVIVRENAKFLAITDKSDFWSEERVLEQPVWTKSDAMPLFPGQSRPLSVDFLIKDGAIPELLKVELIVETGPRPDGNRDEVETGKRIWTTWIGTGPMLGDPSFATDGHANTCVPSY